MTKRFDSFLLKLSLDTVFPLANGTYAISGQTGNLVLAVANIFSERKDIGLFQIHGDVRVHHGNNSGKSEIELTYYCDEPATTEEFAQAKSISPIWHFSPTGWGFVLEDLNRVIDLYRCLANAYWWQNLSMWNIDGLQIYGQCTRDGQKSFLSQIGTTKMLSFAKNHFNDLAYDNDSTYVKTVRNGVSIPFYFLLYLNGRRSYVEHSFRDALVNWANCVEAYSYHLLGSACVLANVPTHERARIIENAGEYKQRYSKAYKIMATVNIFPSISKRQTMKLVDLVMEHRNSVMHGCNLALDWQYVGDKQLALEKLLNVATELAV